MYTYTPISVQNALFQWTISSYLKEAAQEGEEAK